LKIEAILTKSTFPGYPITPWQAVMARNKGRYMMGMLVGRL
jgi:hypothetical protein